MRLHSWEAGAHFLEEEITKAIPFKPLPNIPNGLKLHGGIALLGKFRESGTNTNEFCPLVCYWLTICRLYFHYDQMQASERKKNAKNQRIFYLKLAERGSVLSKEEALVKNSKVSCATTFTPKNDFAPNVIPCEFEPLFVPKVWYPVIPILTLRGSLPFGLENTD